MASINEDCLLKILEYCNLATIIQISKSCKQLKSIVQYHLSNQGFKDVTLTCWEMVDWSFEVNKKTYVIKMNESEYFMELIAPFLSKLRLKTSKGFLFEEIKKFQYPKLHDLRYQCIESDMCTRGLHLSFPNLKTFSPDSEVRAADICHLHNLKELSLKYTRNLSYQDMLKIITELKLETLSLCLYWDPLPTLNDDLVNLNELQTLHINSNEVGIFLNVMHGMKKLRQIAVADGLIEQNIFQLNRILSTLKDRRVVELSLFHWHDNQFSEQFHCFFPYLRKFTIGNYNDGLVVFPLMRELVVLDHCLNDTEWKNFIESATQLDKLRLVKCYTYTETINLDVKKISKTRTKPLVINVVNAVYTVADFFKIKISLSYPTDLIAVQYGPDNFEIVRNLEYIME